ncbi:hypothetical protein AMEX_G3348, partial [Astyanax mexicanus]
GSPKIFDCFAEALSWILLNSVSFPISEIQDLGSTLRPTSNPSSTLFGHRLPAAHAFYNLTLQSQDLILNAVSPNTLSTYWTGWQCFRRFHVFLSIPFPSFDLFSTANFLTFTSSRLYIRSSSLKVYLSAINFFHKLLHGSPHPFVSHPQITLLLKGIKRSEPPLTHKRLPLTSHILSCCLSTLRSRQYSPSISQTLEAMFLLAFFGFLRVSEFTTPSTTHHPSLHPCLSDITILDTDTLIFNIKRSKTNQFGIYTPVYIFRLHSSLSPYEPLQLYLQFRLSQGARPHDPLFISESGSPATSHWFHFHLKNVLSLSGFNPTHFSAHSFRIGAATTASHQGLPDHTVQILGRWSSHVYHSYIRTHARDLFTAHELLASVFP